MNNNTNKNSFLNFIFTDISHDFRVKPAIFILLAIIFLTIFFAYYAFFSGSKLEVDFSLEQMFPENAPERIQYDNFKDEFSREDDKFMLVYKCSNPFSEKNYSKIT